MPHIFFLPSLTYWGWEVVVVSGRREREREEEGRERDSFHFISLENQPEKGMLITWDEKHPSC